MTSQPTMVNPLTAALQAAGVQTATAVSTSGGTTSMQVVSPGTVILQQQPSSQSGSLQQPQLLFLNTALQPQVVIPAGQVAIV